MSTFDTICLFAFLLAGLYCLYTAYCLGRETKLFDNMLLYPGNCRREDCRKPEEFMAYMRPRIAILGGLLVVVSLYYVLAACVTLPKAASIIHMVVTLGVLSWGMYFYHRAAKRFW